MQQAPLSLSHSWFTVRFRTIHTYLWKNVQQTRLLNLLITLRSSPLPKISTRISAIAFLFSVTTKVLRLPLTKLSSRWVKKVYLTSRFAALALMDSSNSPLSERVIVLIPWRIDWWVNSFALLSCSPCVSCLPNLYLRITTLIYSIIRTSISFVAKKVFQVLS